MKIPTQEEIRAKAEADTELRYRKGNVYNMPMYDEVLSGYKRGYTQALTDMQQPVTLQPAVPTQEQMEEMLKNMHDVGKMQIVDVQQQPVDVEALRESYKNAFNESMSPALIDFFRQHLQQPAPKIDIPDGYFGFKFKQE